MPASTQRLRPLATHPKTEITTARRACVPPAAQREPADARAARAALQGPATGVVDPSSRAGAPSRIVAARCSGAAAPVTGWNFDWDDNIFLMPTQIRLVHGRSGEEIGLSTAEFAVHREAIGKTGPYAEYRMTDASLRFFGDPPSGERYFASDVARAIEGPPHTWQGPSWSAFVRAMSDEETAKRTTIITARLHSPRTIHEGLLFLQDRGLLQHVPPVESIFPVSYPPLAAELGGSAANPSAAKAQVMKSILDRLQATPLAEDAPTVRDPSGEETRPLHIWGFSDDDFGNYKKAVDALSAEVKQGRWPAVKIVVFFTGKNHPSERARVEVLTPEGGTRPLAADELAISSSRSWLRP